MAQLPDYRAQKLLNPVATPQVSITNAGANALQGVGAGISDIGSMLVERQQKKDAFKADNAYRRLNVELESELNNAAQTIDPGGAGFMDSFMKDIYIPKRDAFLATVPDALKPKFSEVLADHTGADFSSWQTRSATVERDEGYRWTKSEINLTQTQMAGAIQTNPEGYDAYLKSGKDLIDSAVLPTPEKALLSQQWEETAQVAYLNTLLAKDPQGVLRELGVDARQLSKTTQFEMLSRAVQWQESTDNPNAISPKGAVGLMQVMPDTARDIAKKVGDPNFPTGGSDQVVSIYMSNPFVNKRYGEEYLRQQLNAFSNTRNPIEAALVAYNAGPGAAQAWVESGYDDSTLPAETRKYKDAIINTMSAPTSKGDPGKVQFVATGTSVRLDTVNPDLKNRVADAYATLGLDKVNVNDGSRTDAENKAAGGAEHSQHLEDNAMDLNVTNMTIPQRIELIKSLSSAGITGIGIGANMIHADLGGRRAWGYKTSAGGGAVPKWAEGIIAEHLKGTTPRPVAVNTRFASLPYDKQQQFRVSADSAISQQNAAMAKSSVAQKWDVRNQIANEIASVATSGTSTGIDETAISTILGEDDYMAFVQKRDTARKSFTATTGMNAMSPQDIQDRVLEYQPDDSAGDFAQQQVVAAAVQKEANRIIKLRSTNPAGAALEFPAVQAAYNALPAQDAPPGQVQDFIRLMLETQASMEIPYAARAPIPNAWASEIGRGLSRVPDGLTRESIQEANYSIISMYDALQKTFGDYTDEVIVHSLTEYKSVSKPTAELITSYMTAISAGGDPFKNMRKQANSATDMDQVESVAGPQGNPLDFVLSIFGGGGTQDAQGISAEQMIRQQEQSATDEE